MKIIHFSRGLHMGGVWTMWCGNRDSRQCSALPHVLEELNPCNPQSFPPVVHIYQMIFIIHQRDHPPSLSFPMSLQCSKCYVESGVISAYQTWRSRKMWCSLFCAARVTWVRWELLVGTVCAQFINLTLFIKINLWKMSQELLRKECGCVSDVHGLVYNKCARLSDVHGLCGLKSQCNRRF